MASPTAPAGRGLAPPQQRSRPVGVADAVLGLQRSAGNRAVCRMLQRLTTKQVKGCFENTYADNLDDVSKGVFERIAAVTTKWENEVEGHGYRMDRQRAVESALGKYLSRYEMKELPSPADAEYWEQVALGVIEGLKPKAQKPLDVPEEELIPLAERREIGLTMGQGVVANLGRYSLFSDQFSSCSPVVMFNEKTLVGGLFHYGAKSVIQYHELTSMYERIEPTVIHLNRRPDHGAGGSTKDYSRDDFESLSEFFAKTLGTRARIERIDYEGANYAVYLDDNGRLQIDYGKNASSGRFDATHMVEGAALNPVATLLVNQKVYTPMFATKLF